MARIGLNLLYLIPGQVGGTERYAVALLDEVVRLRPRDSFHVFLSREAAGLPLPEQVNVHRLTGPLPARRRALRYAWEQGVLPFAAWRHGLDLLHSLGYVAPLLAPCPQVVTICDANYRSIRDLMPGLKRAVVPWFVRQSARRADHVLTLSEFAAGEILADTGIPADRISPIHLAGRQDEPDLRADQARWPELSRRFAVTAPYVLAFGGLNPHKNMPRLLQAFAGLCGEVPHRLVLVGHVANLPEVRRAHLRGPLGERVTLTGYLSDQDLGPLLRHADLFVFPTLYEGFGMPVLEAQERGVPVACSRVASLPEIAGDSVAYFDPLRPEDIGATLRRCLLDPSLRADLSRRGLANARRFSWQTTAERTLEVYRQVLRQRRPAVDFSE